ncbi:MAG: hypothetical protein AAB250_17865 [Bdellovibrionota bacterium]
MKLGFAKQLWTLDALTLVGMVIAMVFGPWWSFAVIAWIAGFERSRRGAPGVLPPALIATIAWFLMAFVKDALNGFRISHRIGGFFGLPHGSLLFVVVIAVAFVIAALAAGSGDQLGRLSRAKAAR